MSISSAAIATLEEYEFDPKQGFARLGPGDALEARCHPPKQPSRLRHRRDRDLPHLVAP